MLQPNSVKFLPFQSLQPISSRNRLSVLFVLQTSTRSDVRLSWASRRFHPTQLTLLFKISFMWTSSPENFTVASVFDSIHFATLSVFRAQPPGTYSTFSLDTSSNKPLCSSVAFIFVWPCVKGILRKVSQPRSFNLRRQNQQNSLEWAYKEAVPDCWGPDSTSWRILKSWMKME